MERRAGDKVFRTIVPQHSTLAKGTLSDILKQCGITVEQLLELL
jgi:predicted RNA binding protein YcfA (HicA-like mRNA interferase family)